MHKLTLIAAAAIATVIFAPRTSSAEHIDPPAQVFVR